jgi:hypothetical protein
MKITRKKLRKLIIESMQEQYSEMPSEWQEVEALRDVDMDAYEKQFGGEVQTRKLSSAEEYMHSLRRQAWQDELASEGLDDEWVIDVISSGENAFSDLIKAARNEYPGIPDPESTLLRIIADSEIVHLDDTTQLVHF